MHPCSRAVIAALLAGCGTDDGSGGGGDALAPPESCDVMQLAYVHDLALPAATSGVVAVGGHAFGNAQTTKPGELILYQAGSALAPTVHLYFSELVLDGHIVPARGAIALPDQGIEVANCDGAPYSGWLSVLGNGVYKFGITDLHAAADCSGAAIAGSFAGCYQEQPF